LSSPSGQEIDTGYYGIKLVPEEPFTILLVFFPEPGKSEINRIP
jgi:hypothetical protein